jgi:hypothetical protein
MGVAVVGLNEGVDACAHLGGAGEARPGQSVSGQNAEPDFDLIEPRSMRRNEMKVDILMSPQPAIMLRLVGVEVVQDHMNLLLAIAGHDLVHEVEQLHSPAAPVMAALDQAGGHLQRGKQGGRAVPPVLMIESGERLAIGQLEPALGAFQRLDMRLLVHAQHDRVPAAGSSTTPPHRPPSAQSRDRC